jgi:uncharacterized membrane protein
MPVPCLRADLSNYLSIYLLRRYGYVLLRAESFVCRNSCVLSCVPFVCVPCLRAGRESDCLSVAIASSPRHGRNTKHVLSLLL